MRCCPQVPSTHPSLTIQCHASMIFVESTCVFLCTQVHGVANDTIKFVQNIINTEINSATDNPVSFLADGNKKNLSHTFRP